jgi:hypothetical protein
MKTWINDSGFNYKKHDISSGGLYRFRQYDPAYLKKYRGIEKYKIKKINDNIMLVVGFKK